jgi:hypothetical protein
MDQVLAHPPASAPSGAPGFPYRAYGIELECPFPVPGGRPDEPAVSVAVALVDDGTVDGLWSGAAGPPVLDTPMAGGESFTVHHGRDGDHLFAYGRARFHLSAGLSVLSCTGAGVDDPGWRRILLEWVSYGIAVIAGAEALHASGVLGSSGVVAFAALSGGGKTTLAAELARRGRPLFSDDVLVLSLDDGVVVGEPGPPFVTLDAAGPVAPGALGTPLAELDGEIWTAVHRPAVGRATLDAVVVLDRRPRGPAQPRLEPESFLSVRPHLLSLPHLRRTERERFELLSALADRGRILRLTAAPDAAPGKLADAVEEVLAP